MSERAEWIIAVRLRQLGDVLAALATLQALKRHRPERRIAYVVEAPYAALLHDLDFIDALPSPPKRGVVAWRHYFASLRALQPSGAIDFHGSARSALITRLSGAPVRVGFDVRGRRHLYTIVEARGEFRDGVRIPRTPLVWGMRLARHLGAAEVDAIPPRIPVAAEALARALASLAAAGIDRREVENGHVVGLNPGRPVPVKSWAVARFAELARRVGREGGRALVFWGPGEEATAREIVAAAGSAAVLAPATPLADMPALLSVCTALVTIDSGLKHLAVCTRVPTVTVFGATDPREWHMGSAADGFLWRGLSCSPCRRLECPFGSPCMDISVDEVWSTLHRVAQARERSA